jgi:hypothetical protein
MPCCCSTIYRVCDVIVCDGQDLVLPVTVPADGEYTLELDFLQDVIRKMATLTAGDNFTFNMEDINERFTYVGHIKGPDGAPITFDIDGVVYDCIEFTTKKAL